MLRRAITGAAAGVALVLGVGAVAADARAQTVGVGTMSQGTISFSTGTVIATLMNEALGIEARVQPNTGETVLIPLLNSGELDFGIANVLESAEAYQGQGTFEGQPQENLRIASVLYPLRTAFFVRDDSDIETLEDLEGKRVTVGFVAMGTIDTVVEATLANGGLTMADIRPVLVPNVVVGADQFVNDRADAFFFAVGAAKVAEVDASVPLRMIPMNTDPARVEAMKEIFPDGYIVEMQPAPNLAGIDETTYALGYDNLLLTGAHVSDDLMRQVAEGLAGNKERLIQGFPLFRGFDPDQMVKPDMPLPYHPAVEAWAAER